MTPEQIELHRKRFEKVCGWESSYVLRKDSKGDYECYETGILFQGYLMAIESIEVDLPDRMWSARNMSDGFNDCLDRVKVNLESQGIKVKQ